MLGLQTAATLATREAPGADHTLEASGWDWGQGASSAGRLSP